MSNNVKKIFLFLFILPYLLFSVFALVSAQAEPIKLTYEFPCTGVPGTTCPSSAETAQSPAAYIARFYQFALGIAGMLAFAMIIFGAIQYIFSAGNPTGQKDARDRIFQALWGVALLLGAYLILYTIDPKLVSLTDPNISLPTGNTSQNTAVGSGYAGYQWSEAVRRDEGGGYFSYICPNGGVRVDEHWCGGTAPSSLSFCCAYGQ